MNIKIKTLGFSAKQGLIDFVHQKVGKLSQFYSKIITCEVCLCAEKSDTKENKICDIRLVIPGNDLLTGSHCKTFEEAVTQSVEGLIKQIEKKKAKTHVRQKNRIV